MAGGILVFGGGKTKVEADRRSGLPEISIRSQISKKSLAEHIADSRTAPDAQTGRQEYAITLKTNTDGVEVLLGEDRLCEPSERNECSFTLAKSTGQVELTLRKKGFADSRIKILPDMNKEVYLEMRRLSNWSP